MDINNVVSLLNDMPDGKWLVSQFRQDLLTMTLQEYVDTRLNSGLIGWKHPMFANFAREQEAQDDYVKIPPTVVEGIVSCIRCKSKKVLSTSTQTRASDEPMTLVAECTDCGLKWKENS